MKKLLIGLLTLASVSLSAEVKGRVEAAPIYMHLDVVQSGKTNHKVDMVGVRTDGTIVPFERVGFCLKPYYFAGWNKNSSHLYQYGIGFGHYTPVNETITIIPIVGVSASRLQTFFDSAFLGPHLKERFRSRSLYLAGELIYKFNECFYVTGVYQYAWARTETDIDVIGTSKGNSQGSNYAVVIDYYVKNNVSIATAFGYTNSLSKEKHGLKGYGIKCGIAYLF